MTKRAKKEGWYGEDGKVRRGLPNLIRFFSELQKLRAKHFEKDEDGDYPVYVSVTDRTATERNDYVPLPLMPVGDEPTDEQLADALQVIAGNVATLNEQARRVAYRVRDRVVKSTRWGCGCHVEARPDEKDVMTVRLNTCKRHDDKYDVRVRRTVRRKP